MSLLLCVLLDDVRKYFSFNKNKPFYQPELNEAYSRFSRIGKEYGVKIIYAKYTNYSKGFVNKYWIFEEKWKKKSKKIKADLFYDKFPVTKKGIALKKELTKEKKLFNIYTLEEFCKDKLAQAKKFPKMSPKTILVKNKNDLEKAKKEIIAERIILKPRYGRGGFGIKIINKKQKPKLSTEYIAQEFIDTIRGLPSKKINGVHDLRAIIINGFIAFSYVRVPRKGLLANLHQGGKAIKFNAPKKVRNKIKEIDSFMKKFGKRVYSADFFYSKGKYYLVELNSKPGFDVSGKYGFAKEENKFFRLFFKEIVLKMK
jgi:glutathione synthase/RimK-type ligase-like ATP-grasp enzyme